MLKRIKPDKIIGLTLVFLFGIFLGEGWISLGADSLPGAIGFPFPAISLLSFLMVFYYSIKQPWILFRV